jgi:nucleotide-binding universal stress UspA family protein
MNGVLACIDFSPVTDRVVREAERLVRADGQGRLILLHVAPPDPDFVGYDVGPQNVRDSRAEKLRRVHAELGRRADELRGRGVDAHAVLVEGATVDTILEKAREVGATTIVVGSHGHGRLYDALAGSVSGGVLRGATRPVLVVPSREA